MWLENSGHTTRHWPVDWVLDIVSTRWSQIMFGSCYPSKDIDICTIDHDDTRLNLVRQKWLTDPWFGGLTLHNHVMLCQQGHRINLSNRINEWAPWCFSFQSIPILAGFRFVIGLPPIYIIHDFRLGCSIQLDQPDAISHRIHGKKNADITSFFVDGKSGWIY